MKYKGHDIPEPRPTSAAHYAGHAPGAHFITIRVKSGSVTFWGDTPEACIAKAKQWCDLFPREEPHADEPEKT